MIVLSYDVDTTDAAGAKRLRKVAKICEAKGCRVQNSVFELLVDPAQLTTLKAQLKRSLTQKRIPYASTVWAVIGVQESIIWAAASAMSKTTP